MNEKNRIALIAAMIGAAVVTFMIASGSPAFSMSNPLIVVQSGLHQTSDRIGMQSQNQGHMLLVGTNVRDHRSTSSNVRDHRTGTGTAQGGVAVSEGKTRTKSGTKVCTKNPFSGKLVCVSQE